VDTRLIVPLLLAIGYSTDDIGSKVAIVFQTGKQGRPYEADYIVYDGKIHNEDTSLIVSEVKSRRKASPSRSGRRNPTLSCE
jgi:hypothetical protein